MSLLGENQITGKRSEKAQQIQELIRQVLFYNLDPVGINDSDLDDEVNVLNPMIASE